jgi:hypothetical protein
MSTVGTTAPRATDAASLRPAEGRKAEAKPVAAAQPWSLTITLSRGASATTDLATLLDLPQDARDRHDKSKAMVAQLEQAGKAMIGDRKAAAQQKLDRARAKLQMLRMFGGDPKAMARQARQIAQEIREAAREYGAALKAEGGGAAAVPAVPAPPTTPSGPTASGEGTDAAEGGAAAATSGDAKAGEDGQAERGKLVAGFQNAAAEMASKGDKARAEREAIDKFKQAADEAKRLIEEAIRRLKAEKANDPLIGELEKAKGAMTKAIGELDDAADSPAPVAAASVTAPASAVPVPIAAIDILA